MKPKPLLALCALLLPAMSWAADAPAPAVKPVRIFTVAPVYPPSAARFHLSGTVLAKMRIEADGHVSNVEILESPADMLSKAVVAALSQWRYQPLQSPTESTMKFPFRISEDDYAHSTEIRGMSVPAPTSAADLGGQLTEGWSDVRLMIDPTGKVEGMLVLKSSGDDFAATREAIISRLKFNPAPADAKEFKSTSVNVFSIRVVTGGTIKVDQYDGA